MKNLWKILIAIAVFLILAFVIGMNAINFQFFKHRFSLENQLSKIFHAKSVQIKGFSNIPLMYVEIRELRLNLEGRTRFVLKKVRLNYNILKAFGGMSQALTALIIKNAEFNGNYNDLDSMVKRIHKKQSPQEFDRNQKIDLPSNLKLRILRFNSKLVMSGPFYIELHSSNTRFLLRHSQLSGGLSLNLGVQFTNQVNYLSSALKIDLNHLDLKTHTGNGILSFSNVNLAGLKVLDQDYVVFDLSNRIRFLYHESRLSNRISFKKGKLKLYLDENLPLEYPKYKEHDLFDYLFDPGEFHFRMQGVVDLKKSKLNIGFNIKKTNDSKENFSLSFFSERKHFRLLSKLHARKGGNWQLNLKFTPNVVLPSGTATIEGVPFIKGMPVSGRINLISRNNTALADVRDLKIRGGKCGLGRLQLISLTNGLFLSNRSRKRDNIFVNGAVRDTGVDLNLAFKWVRGQALVKNIGLDFLNIGKGLYKGKMDLQVRSTNLWIQSELTGYRRGKPLVTASLVVTNTTLYLKKVDFPKNHLVYSGIFDFNLLDPALTPVRIQGTAVLNHRYYFPVSGDMQIDNESLKVMSSVTVDRKMKVHTISQSGQTYLTMDLSSYSLSKFGLFGNLQGRFGMNLSKKGLNALQLKLKYNNIDRWVSMEVRAKRKGRLLPLSKFVIKHNDDTVFGDGTLWTSGNRLLGKVSFVRGGGLNFSSSFEDINASLNLQKVFIKNFLEQNLNVLFSSYFLIRGNLVFPDFSGTLSFVNTRDSHAFRLNIHDMYKKGKRLKIQGFNLKDPNYLLQTDLTWDFAEKGWGRIRAEGIGTFQQMIAGAFSLDFSDQGKKKKFSYDLKQVRISGEPFADLKGNVLFSQNRYHFYHDPNKAGLSGEWLDRKKIKEWSLDFSADRLNATFDGHIRKKEILANIAIKSDLKLVGFLPLIKDLNGSGKLDLKFSGKSDKPDINGTLRLYRASFGIDQLTTGVRNLSTILPVHNGNLVFRSFVLPTTTGNFRLEGYVDLSEIQPSYVDLSLTPIKLGKERLLLEIQSPMFKLSGVLLPEKLSLMGNPLAMKFEGKANFEKGVVVFTVAHGKSKPMPDILKGMVWNTTFFTGSGVKFENEFIDTTLNSGQKLQAFGSMGNRTFVLKGVLSAAKGNVSYLGRSLMVKEATATFSGTPEDPLPYVSVDTSFRTRDKDGENLDIYLTFAGKANKIKLKDFYSVPSLTKDEVLAYLGFKGGNITQPGSTNAQYEGNPQKMLTSSIDAGVDYVLLFPISMAIRKNFGLDLFTIRSAFASYLASTVAVGDSFTNKVNVLDVSVGKYLSPYVFLEFQGAFYHDPLTYNISPVLSFGLDLDLRYFDFGYKLSPIIEDGNLVNIEHRLELNLRKKF